MARDDTLKKAFIHSLYASPLSGGEIEARSLAVIDSEAPAHEYSPMQWPVVRRMIHTTSEFGIIGKVRFSPDAIDAAITALQHASSLYVDSNMIRSGLSLARLQRVNPDYNPDKITCYVRDEGVAAKAGQAGLPRALFAVRKAIPMLDGAIVIFGNSPVGLLELNRLILEEKVKPALVIGMPVGFVHVVESKEELMTLGVPYIVLVGRRGGSPLAVSVVHALCSLAQPESGKQK